MIRLSGVQEIASDEPTSEAICLAEFGSPFGATHRLETSLIWTAAITSESALRLTLLYSSRSLVIFLTSPPLVERYQTASDAVARSFASMTRPLPSESHASCPTHNHLSEVSVTSAPSAARTPTTLEYWPFESDLLAAQAIIFPSGDQAGLDRM